MYFVVFVADFLWGYTFFQGSCFDCCAVFICAANVERIDVADFTVSSKDVGTEYGADYVSEMRYVVDVGKCRGNEDVSLPGDR